MIEVDGDPVVIAAALGDHDGVHERELVHAEGSHGVLYALAESADAAGCVSSTASEHLRKAEAALVRASFE